MALSAAAASFSSIPSLQVHHGITSSSSLSRMQLLLQNDHGYSFEVPAALNDQCRSVYGWSDTWTQRAIVAYQQFIKLKLQHHDFTTASKILEPSWTVECVWQQHILNVQHYVQACHSYTGGHLMDHGWYDPQQEPKVNLAANNRHDDNNIKHNQHQPSTHLTPKQQRIYTTQIALITLLGKGQVDHDIWDWKGDEPPNWRDQYFTNPSHADKTENHHHQDSLVPLVGRCVSRDNHHDEETPSSSLGDNDHNDNDSVASVTSCISSSTISIQDDSCHDTKHNQIQKDDDRILLWLHTGRGIQTSERYRISKHAPLKLLFQHHELLQRRRQRQQQQHHKKACDSIATGTDAADNSTDDQFDNVQFYFHANKGQAAWRASSSSSSTQQQYSSPNNHQQNKLIQVMPNDTPFALGMKNHNAILVCYNCDIDDDNNDNENDIDNGDDYSNNDTNNHKKSILPPSKPDEHEHEHEQSTITTAATTSSSIATASPTRVSCFPSAMDACTATATATATTRINSLPTSASNNRNKKNNGNTTRAKNNTTPNTTNNNTNENDEMNDRLTLQIRLTGTETLHSFKARKGSPLERILIDWFAKRVKIADSISNYQFWCRDRVINIYDGMFHATEATPMDFGLQHMDVIECRPRGDNFKSHY